MAGRGFWLTALICAPACVAGPVRVAKAAGGGTNQIVLPLQQKWFLADGSEPTEADGPLKLWPIPVKHEFSLPAGNGLRVVEMYYQC
jgi:hypothetical protein